MARSRALVRPTRWRHRAWRAAGWTAVLAGLQASAGAEARADTNARADADTNAHAAADADADAHADAPIDVTVRAPTAAGFASTARLDDARREVTDAASLVEPLPGVHVRRFGADDAFATLSIRGSTSTQVTIRLAGVPLTGAADPSLDLATLPLWPGARARVYRSFAPAAIGPSSLGGTLVLDPPSARTEERSEVWTAVGSFGARRMRVGDVRALDERGEVRLATAISASRSDDDFTYYDPLSGDFTTRENAGHAAANGLVSLAMPVHWSPTSTGALTITAIVQARRQKLPGIIKLPTPHQELASNRALASLELSGPAATGAWSVRAWGRRDGDRLTDDRVQLQILGPTHTNDAIVAAGGSFGWRGRIGRAVTLEARADGSEERYAPGAWLGTATPPGASRASSGAGLDVDAHVTNAWTVSGSARADAWLDGTDDASSRLDARPTAHLGTELARGPLVLSAHGGAVARPPSFVERFGDRGGFLGDPSLRPESAWTADAGASFTLTRGHSSRLALAIAGFGTWASDLITFVAEGAYGRARATNIGRARLLGAEAEIDASALGFDLRASYTGLVTANEADCVAATGASVGSAACVRPALPGRPSHDVVGDLTYSIGAFRVRYGVDVVSGIVADRAGNVVVPARVLQSAGARFDVANVGGGALRLALDLRNLFDVRTASYDGVLGPVREPIGDAYQYPLPGRSFLLSAAWTLGRGGRRDR